jgi:TATA-box binding protein (TBP) (component of TFIID and TFIIIB)
MLLTPLDEEWINFTKNSKIKEEKKSNKKTKEEIEKNVTDIYISTKTKIAYLNATIDLHEIFWELPVLNYSLPQMGVLKKSIKINCINEQETKDIDNIINNIKNVDVTIISNLKSEKKYKDVRKIAIGVCQKDLYSYRQKKKGAFYNCFAIIMRVKYKDKFKEVHIKIFNTGKLEIPGIREEELLIISLNKLCEVLQNVYKSINIEKNISYDEKNIQNVLINSNFSCGFYINRNVLSKILKFKYNLQPIYDPCSYPGIQCKFYYNNTNITKHKGLCNCEEKCYFKKKKEKKNCREISFMIFRTGSVLIVGHADEPTLIIVYKFIKELLINEYEEIYQNTNNENKKKKSIPKIRRKTVLFTIK